MDLEYMFGISDWSLARLKIERVRLKNEVSMLYSTSCHGGPSNDEQQRRLLNRHIAAIDARMEELRT